MASSKVTKPTRVGLESIDFRNSDSDVTNSSLGIYPISSGWVSEHFSYAAYSIKDTQQAIADNKLKIWARFHKNTGKGSVQVRAVSVTPPIPDALEQRLFKRYSGQDAMGHIEPTRVFFGGTGQSVFRGKRSNVPFTITAPQFPKLGIGVYDIIWRWEFRILSPRSTDDNEIWMKKWVPIKSSTHRIFIVADTPKFPWTPFILPNFNSAPPYPSPVWAEALMIACRWAQGSKTIREAGQKIADQLFASGKFVYHPDSHYYKEKTAVVTKTLGADGTGQMAVHTRFFYLSKVIERLKGGNGLGDKVNCLDCSLIVSTLTNVLGGNLRVGKLQCTSDTDYTQEDIITKNRFEIKAIKAIGSTDSSSTMAGLEKDGKHYFSFHSIAWQPPEDVEEVTAETFNHPESIIYDACVHFVLPSSEDGEEQYETASGLPLGANGETESYRHKLAASTEGGIDRCIAQPETVIKIQLQ
jgi:hypothetical protein